MRKQVCRIFNPINDMRKQTPCTGVYTFYPFFRPLLLLLSFVTLLLTTAAVEHIIHTYVHVCMYVGYWTCVLRRKRTNAVRQKTRLDFFISNLHHALEFMGERPNLSPLFGLILTSVRFVQKRGGGCTPARSFAPAKNPKLLRT